MDLYIHRSMVWGVGLRRTQRGQGVVKGKKRVEGEKKDRTKRSKTRVKGIRRKTGSKGLRRE